MPEKPLISIITVNLNDVEGLKRTMTSVFEQTYKEYEYIVIDGGSTDGSKEYIESHSDKIDTWVSEKDSGIYNAMNKGIKVATGEYFLFLNSGDWLHKVNILEITAPVFSNNYSIYYGNVERIYNGNKKKIKTYPSQLSFSFFIDSALAHQAVFIKRSLFFDLFLYNERSKVLGDWEFLIVAICKYNIKTFYLNRIISYYPMNGISSSTKGRQIMDEERERCYKEHFPLFIQDWKELENNRVYLNSPKVKLFREINSTRRLSVITFFILKKFKSILKIKNMQKKFLNL